MSILNYGSPGIVHAGSLSQLTEKSIQTNVTIVGLITEDETKYCGCVDWCQACFPQLIPRKLRK